MLCIHMPFCNPCQSEHGELDRLQCAVTPAVNVYLPKDRVTSQHQGYGFVEFKSEEDADYVRHTAYSCTTTDLGLPASGDCRLRFLQG